MLARAENILLFELFNLITYVRKDDFTCASMNRVIYDYVYKIFEEEEETSYDEILEEIVLNLEAKNDSDISSLEDELSKELIQYNRFKILISLGLFLFRKDMHDILNVLSPYEADVFDSDYYRTGMNIVCESARTIAKNDTLLKSEELKKEILQVIMDSGGDIFNINTSLIQSSLLSLPQMRYLIIKSALKEFLSERSFLINDMTENNKKYLLYYVTMLLIDCGRFGSFERELLIKACRFFHVDVEYINEFEALLIQKLKVAQQLNDINDELEILINE